ncbi:MAG: hypothetical protein ABI416_11325 [Ginsengibacter sp.]
MIRSNIFSTGDPSLDLLSFVEAFFKSRGRYRFYAANETEDTMRNSKEIHTALHKSKIENALAAVPILKDGKAIAFIGKYWQLYTTVLLCNFN